MVSESRPEFCPNCGNTPVSKCVYGLIGEPYVAEYVKDDEHILMGCIVTACDPSWFCKKCETMFFETQEKMSQYHLNYEFNITSDNIWNLNPANWTLLNNDALKILPRRIGVYIFRNKNGVFGRLHGESDILYIGSTTNTIRQRINQYLHPGPTQSTNIRINKMLEKYRVEVNWILTDAPRRLESTLLQRYITIHDELPPFNYQSTAVTLMPSKPSPNPTRISSNSPRETNAEIVMSLLKEYGHSLCDDCLSIKTKITPRQQVNQIARRLAEQGEVKRNRDKCHLCKTKKIVNTLM